MSEYRSEHRVKLDGVKTVNIFNPIGRIEVIGWNESDLFIDFSIKTSGETHSGESFEPLIEHDGNNLTIKPPMSVMADHSESFSFSFDSDAESGSEDHAGGLSEFIGKIVHIAQKSVNGLGSGIKSSMTIRLPKSMDVKVKNLNGVITLSDLDSSVHAKGLNGPITLSRLRGTVIAQTVNGPVHMEKGRCPDLTLKSVNGPIKCYLDAVCGPVVLKTVNGPIRMMVPADAEINLTAQTMHGAMKVGSEFVSSHRTSRKIQSSLNAGQYDVTIKTTAGPITVLTSEEPVSDAASKPMPPKPPMPPMPPMPPRPPEPLRPLTAPLPIQAPPDAATSPAESQPQTEKASVNRGETDHSLEAQIDRMLSTGKITADEANRLRRAI